MRVAVGRTREDRLARLRANETQKWIAEQAAGAEKAKNEKAANSKEQRRQATTTIQAGLRGFRGRYETRFLRKQIWAGLLAQRLYRGYLGRQAAKYKRWQKASVVKSMPALERLQERSEVTHSQGGWVEYYDPETRALWYLETDTYRSTWGRPEDLDFGLRRRERIYDAQRKRERDELLVGPPEATWHKGFYLSRKKEEEEEDKGIVITESGLVLEISDDDISEFSEDEDLDDETTQKRRTAKMAVKAKGTGGDGPSEPTDIPEDQMGLGIGGKQKKAKEFASPEARRLAKALEKEEKRVKQLRGDMGISREPVGDNLDDFIKRIYPKRKGLSLKLFQGGTRAEGYMKDGQFEGFGTCVWPADRGRYTGDWKNGKRHGEGIYTKADGTEYVGEWREGRRDGWGCLFHPCGEMYEGEWRAGRMHGFLSVWKSTSELPPCHRAHAASMA